MSRTNTAPPGADANQRRAASTLFSGVALGFCAGAIIPTWAAHYDNEAIALVTAVTLLIVMACMTVVAAALTHHLTRGLVFGGIAVVATVAIFFVSWFTVTPGMVSAVWLATSAAAILPLQREALRAVVITSACALLITAICSLYLIELVPDAGQLLASLLHALFAAGLGALAFFTSKNSRLMGINR